MDICHRLDPDCKACGKPVYWKKRIFYLNKLWHLDCFKCSKCKIKLNTDVDIDDERYSKAFLGEDYALRCFKCNNIFEQKKSANLQYRKSKILNYYENELINEKNLDQYLKYDKINNLDQHIKYCNNNEQIYQNINIDNNFQKFLNQHKCIENCKQHKYLKDQLDDNQLIKSSDLLFKKDNNLKNKKCNCTGCIEYMKNLKIN